MIVVDASVVVQVLLQFSKASAIETWLVQPDQTLHAPHLIDLEVAQVMRRYVLAGRIDQHAGQAALTHLDHLSIERYGHAEFLDRIWSLRNNLSAYDAAYVALAEALDAPLLTRDHRLAAAPGHNARIVLV